MWLKSAPVRHFFLTHLSRPASDRPVYQVIRRHGLRRIVELGVGLAERSVRMIEMAAMETPAEQIVYTGVDLFELRRAQDGPGLSLKLAHRKLVAMGAKVRLLPGDPYSAMARAVNMLGTADLVVVAGDQDSASVRQAWYFIDRLLTNESQVLVQEPGSATDAAFRVVPLAEVRQLAAAAAPRRRAAA